jgi:hypothetical protein
MQDLRVGTRTVLTILKLAGLAGLAGPVFLSSAAWSDVPNEPPPQAAQLSHSHAPVIGRLFLTQSSSRGHG